MKRNRQPKRGFFLIAAALSSLLVRCTGRTTPEGDTNDGPRDASVESTGGAGQGGATTSGTGGQGGANTGGVGTGGTLGGGGFGGDLTPNFDATRYDVTCVTSCNQDVRSRRVLEFMLYASFFACGGPNKGTPPTPKPVPPPPDQPPPPPTPPPPPN